MTDAEADRAAWTVWNVDTEIAQRDAAPAEGADGAPTSSATESPKVGGARSIALGLAVGRDARWPLLPWRLPGLPWVLDRVYDVVAANRHRLPGETPWCEVHPDQCAEFAP